MLRRLRDADINLLRVFVAVAESGGIAAAQYRLNVSPSTIGTQISHLETRLGHRLCYRGRAGFSLTSEGGQVLAAAYDLFRELDRFVQRLDAIDKEVLGIIRILVLDGLIQNPNQRISEGLARLRESYPQLQFDIRQNPPNQLEQAILKDEADLAVTWLPAVFPSLTAEVLFEEDQVICCGRAHPLYERAPDRIQPADLEDLDWVHDGYFLPSSIPFVKPPFSTAMTNFVDGIAYFVLAGTHLAFMPRPHAEQWFASGEMRPILPEVLSFRLPMSLVARKAALRDKRIRAVRQTLVELHRSKRAAAGGPDHA